VTGNEGGAEISLRKANTLKGRKENQFLLATEIQTRRERKRDRLNHDVAEVVRETRRRGGIHGSQTLPPAIHASRKDSIRRFSQREKRETLVADEKASSEGRWGEKDRRGTKRNRRERHYIIGEKEKRPKHCSQSEGRFQHRKGVGRGDLFSEKGSTQV